MNFTLTTFLFILISYIASANKGATKLFKRWDANGDGVLVKEEIPSGPRALFDKKDSNGDGKITLEEHLGNSPRKPKNKPSNNPPKLSDSIIQKKSIRQTWSQETKGYDRNYYVSIPKNPKGKLPVIFIFHGNGGNASRTIARISEFKDDCILVSAQGYKNSWNVHGENSKAPDVDFFRAIHQQLKNEPTADLSNVTLVGYSNGGAYITRLLIEIDKPLFHNTVCIVSSLLETQYHDNSFWTPVDKNTDNYSQKKTLSNKRDILFVQGSEDKVIPYKGGLRFGKHKHLSAQASTFAFAKNQGYSGTQLTDSGGTEIAKKVIQYSYPKARVRLWKVIGAGHSIGSAKTLVTKEIQRLIKK